MDIAQRNHRWSFHMHFRRLARIGLVILPIVAACDEENDLGLGLGNSKRFTATLSGSGVRPSPVATTTTATAEFSVREPEIGSTRRTLSYTVTGVNLTSATAVHLHLGGSAVSNGPILATLFTNPTDTAITAAQLVTGSIAEDAVLGGVSFDSLVTLMQNGTAYVDVHSTARPGGVVRGQISRPGQQAPGDVFAATGLAGSKERPTAVASTATGSATFELLPNNSVRFKVTVAGITGVRAAHIRTAVADSVGPIAVTLFTTTTPTGAMTGPLATGTFTATNIELPGVGLDSLLSLMRRGRTYVNVQTVLNPTGEIRAQIEPVSTLPQ